MTPRDGCFAPQNSEEQPENQVFPLFFRAPNNRLPRNSARTRCRWLINRCKEQQKQATHLAVAKCNRRPRESGGPEPALA